MSKLNIDMIREIQNNHPAVPEPFLNESKLLDVEEDCRKAFLSSRTGRLGAFGKAFHSFIEAPSGDLVSAYILAIDSEDERKADVLLRFYRLREKGRFCYIAIRSHSCLRRCRSPAIRSRSSPRVSSARMSCWAIVFRLGRHGYCSLLDGCDS